MVLEQFNFEKSQFLIFWVKSMRMNSPSRRALVIHI
jgi:hypothetical protein